VNPAVVTYNRSGRGSLAVSILSRREFKAVFGLLGGKNAWKSLGYLFEAT
jgi:rhodanese-related sulfurtransferase